MDSKFSNTLLDNFPGNTCMKCYMYKGMVVREGYQMIADAIENFEVRDDDIWICSYPRSGTTWTQEMVWNIVNDLDFEKAQICIERRTPFLENTASTSLVDPSAKTLVEYVENIAKLPSPRIIKTHLQFSLLPRQLRKREKSCKIIYVSRNPKDISISCYYFFKMATGYSGTLEDVVKASMENKLPYTPYWDHLNGFIENKNDKNILSIKFEDMKSFQDLRSTIKTVSAYLGKKLDDQQITDLESHLSFANMQKNQAVNHEELFATKCKQRGDTFCEKQFIRSGKVDQWKTAMSEELINLFDDWIQNNS